ncbi:unnamed protein product [Merluccius merluccius]
MSAVRWISQSPPTQRASCVPRRRGRPPPAATGSPAHPEGPAPGVSLWAIMSKVRLEACMWQGAGTAIGELPPYFMARAARLSGANLDNRDYQDFEEMMEQDSNAQDFGSRAKMAVHKLIQQVGFLGILACASKLFVIITFSKHIVEQMVTLIG